MVVDRRTVTGDRGHQMTRRTVYAIAVALLLIAADARPQRASVDDWARHWGPWGLPAYGHMHIAPLRVNNTWDTAVRET